MAWSASGLLVESCSCNLFCPCWYTVPEVMIMDQGWCASALTFHFQNGQSDGVDLAGRTVVLGIDFPGPLMFDGNATARLYIDEGASEDQRRELEAIVQGRKGGPMGALAPLVSRWLPSYSSNIQVREDGDTVTVTVEGTGQVDSRTLRDQQGQNFELRGGGFISAFGMPSIEMAPTTGSRWSDPELPRFFETRSGARGNFAWQG